MSKTNHHTKTNKIIPNHVGLIMDGNGRWGDRKGLDRLSGHREGKNAVIEVVEGSIELGISYLTLYTFSIENWQRSTNEVNGLMQLLFKSIQEEEIRIMDNNICFNVIGDISLLPLPCSEILLSISKRTSSNDGLVLTLALSYSGRWDIVNSCKRIVKDYKKTFFSIDDIDEEFFNSYLSTHNLPYPEFIIRTGGEYRISNFLLWQSAYSELDFCDILWPDLKKSDFYEAIDRYQSRKRRFGKLIH